MSYEQREIEYIDEMMKKQAQERIDAQRARQREFEEDQRNEDNGQGQGFGGIIAVVIFIIVFLSSKYGIWVFFIALGIPVVILLLIIFSIKLEQWVSSR